jgi:hypothetical protein
MTDEYIERDRGILTEADRKYIKNLGEFSRQAAHQREEAIRNRVREAVRDFQLLADEMDQRVYNELYSPRRETVEDESGNPVESTEIPGERVSLPYGVEFLIRLSLADEIDMRPQFYELAGIERPLQPFLRNLERGIQLYLNNHEGLSAEVDVDINATEVEKFDRVVERLREQDEPLTGKERLETASQLGRAGYSTEEIIDLIGDRDRDDESAGSPAEE